MKVTFILTGLILILFLFGVFRHKSSYSNFLIVFALLLSTLGEFVGSVVTPYFSMNIFYMFSFLILFFVFVNKSVCSKIYIYLFLSIAVALVLLFDLDFLSVFSFALLYMLLSVTFLFFYNSPKDLFVSMLSMSFLFYLIDGYFQYVEMGYAIIDLSKSILPMIVFGAISCAYTFSSIEKRGRVVYE